MKTLKTKVLAIALLLSVAPVFGMENGEKTTTPATPATEGTTSDFRRELEQNLSTIREIADNEWTTTAPTTKGFFARMKTKASEAWETVKANPKKSAAVVAGTVAVTGGSVALYKYFANKKVAKAELLKALEAKNVDAVEKAFNKLNKANKATVKSAFDAYKNAVNAEKSAHRRRKARAARTTEQKRVALVNVVKTLKTTGVLKTIANKIKEYKKTSIAAATAAAVAAYELVNYKCFSGEERNNPITLRNAYNKVKARWFTKSDSEFVSSEELEEVK